MRLTFRQGIARYQTDVYATPTFLRKSVPAGDFIDLIVSPDPTIVVFAHRNATYLIEESRTVTNAWGPFEVASATRYLYWDINLLDASLTRAYTLAPPIHSAVAPDNPSTDQHWFDTTNHQMKVWNGTKWLDKLRVFAATYSSTGIINPMPLGTQAGEAGSFDAGNLVLDAFNKPLRQSDGTFVTSATELSIINAATKKVKFETEIISGMADEYIPKFSWVQVRKNRRVILGRSDNWKTRVAGMVIEDLYQSEVGIVQSSGLIRNEQWHWPDESVGRPVFCGTTGEVTLLPPKVGVNQICGYVYDSDTIQIEIKPVTILDDITQQIEAKPSQPIPGAVADFTGTPRTGVAPLRVKFTSTSLHNPHTVEWDFTNDGSFDAIGNNVEYVYTQPGSYSIRNRATNDYGSDEETKNNFITVNAPVQADNLKTNLGIQLGGPLQVSAGQSFSISVTVANDGNRHATQVSRVVTLFDVGALKPTVDGLPTGSIVERVNNTTVVTFPVLPTLSSGQYMNFTFQVLAPAIAGTLKVYGSVVSPELDSTDSDNTTELSIKVK